MKIKLYKLPLILCFLLFAEASYAIERSCNAYYKLERSRVVIPSPPPPSLGVEEITVKFGHFDAVGSCDWTDPKQRR